MAIFSIPGTSINGMVAAVPVNEANNADLAILDEREKNDIIQKVGIRSRRIAPASLTAADLCVAAAGRLLRAVDMDPSSIGILVFVTQTPDHLLPGNSMVAQAALGLPVSTLLLDLNQGCAGYVYGLSTLSAMMHSAGIRYGLLLVGDTITRLLSPADRTTLPIFSDAGSATLLEQNKTGTAMHFNLGSDSKGFKAIYVRDGGSRLPFRAESLEMKEDAPGIRRAGIHLRMEGVDVLNYSLKNVVPNIRELMEYTHCTADAIDYFIFHQANRILNENLAKKMGTSQEKTPETLSVFGNTGSATLPVTVTHRLGADLLTNHKKILLSGFGVGFSWGSALLDTGPMKCCELIEIKAPDAP